MFRKDCVRLVLLLPQKLKRIHQYTLQLWTLRVHVCVWKDLKWQIQLFSVSSCVHLDSLTLMEFGLASYKLYNLLA